MQHPLAERSTAAQASEFERMVLRNPYVRAILERAPGLSLSGWYLGAGCLFQTVWNLLSEREPAAGIKDYDLVYFDDSDLSWEAEDRAIRRCAAAFDDLGVEVEVRNQARVHLWYEDRFGVACPPYQSTEAAIDTFPATVCCLGIRRLDGAELSVYAPYGFGDLFGLVLRPNTVLAPRHVYEAKARRWSSTWPRAVVLPWPEASEETVQEAAVHGNKQPGQV